MDNNLYISDAVRTVRYSDGSGGLYSEDNEIIISGRTSTIRGIRNDGSVMRFDCDGINQRFLLGNSSTNTDNCLLDCYNNIDLHNFSILNQSDARLKENISATEINAIEILNQIELKKFDWIEDGAHEDIGIIAQQLRDVIPDLVMEDSLTGKLSIKENKFIPYLIKGIQELYDIIKNIYDNSTGVSTYQNKQNSEWKDTYSIEDKQEFIKSITTLNQKEKTELVRTPMQLT